MNFSGFGQLSAEFEVVPIELDAGRIVPQCFESAKVNDRVTIRKDRSQDSGSDWHPYPAKPGERHDSFLHGAGGRGCLFDRLPNLLWRIAIIIVKIMNYSR